MTNIIKLWLYPGANPAQASTLWGPYETDISQYVRRPGQDGGAPVQYSWGKQDESTQTDASNMTLTLDNRDGRFSTDNLFGTYYGLIDINTPIRMGVVVGTETWNRTVTGALGPAAGWGAMSPPSLGSWINSSAGSGTTTYSADGTKGLVAFANTVTSLAIADGLQGRDVDIVTTVYPVQAATGASTGGGHSVRYTDTSNLNTTSVEFNAAGDVTVKIRSVIAGVQTELAAINPMPATSYTAGVPWKIRTQADGSTIRMKAWSAASAEPTTWTLSATEPTNQGTGVGTYTGRFSGNTNTGAIIGYEDFTVTAIEFTGYVYSWPLQWDITGNNSWAPIAAGGILRRLRQGTNPVVSPLTSQLRVTADSVGYWPMEDGTSSNSLATLKANGRVALISGVTAAGDTSLAGATQSPTMDADNSIIRCYVSTGVNSGGTGFAAMTFFKLQSIPSVKTRVATVYPKTGNVASYAFSVDALNTILEAFDSTGALITSVANGFATDLTTWNAWQLETDNTLSGGNTTATGIIHQVGKTDYFAQVINISGTTLQNVSQIALQGGQGAAFAHTWLGRNTLPFVTDSFSLVSSGYATERAADRFARVAGEAGITYAIRGGGTLKSAQMGPQKESRTLAILQSCVDTDYGVMAERSEGLEFIPKAARFNAASLYTFSKVAGEIGQVPTPTRDDQRLKNKWTVNRVNGSTAIYQNDASVARNGPWEDSVTVNSLDDSNLLSQGSWRAYIGTNGRLRWPNVGLNFARAPQLAKVWRQRFYGWRFGVSTGLTQVAGNEPDLIMEGFAASLDPDVWAITMNCTDAGTWQVGNLGGNRLAAKFTTLGATLTTTGTTLTFSISSALERWRPGLSTASVIVNSEEIALGTISAVSGTGPWTQTVTGCTRSVNGVVKTHALAESVTVKNAIRLTL